jgi:plasmid maintenance system antidote protein VapI
VNSEISIIKGIHPGIILGRELKLRNLAKSRFALSIDEFPQTLVSITKGKRKMNTNLALRIEKKLNIEEGYFMILQLFYDIAVEKHKHAATHPDLSKLRSVLFWDTDIKKINWEKHKSAVIKRVFERGNEEEKNEITRFYSNDLL